MIHDAAAAVKRRLHGPDRGITGLLYLLGERTEKNESRETDAVVANRDHALCKRRQMRQRGGDNGDDYENQPASQTGQRINDPDTCHERFEDSSSGVIHGCGSIDDEWEVVATAETTSLVGDGI